MNIKNFYNLNVFIDELNIFETGGCTLVDLKINEGITIPIPTCSLIISVPVQWMNQYTMVDGTLIRIDIEAPTFDLSESLYFRLFDIQKIAINQQLCTVSLSGMLDFYPGYRDANEFNLYATSSDVFKNIAKKLKLTSDIDQTNDLQLWVSGEDNLYQFLSRMAKFGWVNETSAMLWWFDRHKILLYKNLTTLFTQRSGNIWKFVQKDFPDITKNEYEYTLADTNIPSGSENIAKEGYGGEDKYFDLPSYSWKTVAATKAIAGSSLINLNKTHSKGLASAWYPFDMGNFHKNYWLARKQNARLLALYSTYVNLTCQYLMNYRVGQIVSFNLTDGRDIHNKINLASGLFFINAITININTQNISTNLQLGMQGLNGSTVIQETY